MFETLNRRKLLIPAVMTAAGLALLVSLGSWQLNRKVWKEDVLRTLSERRSAAPLSPEATRARACIVKRTAPGDARDCDFLAVTLRGTYDMSRERHIFAAIDKARDGMGGAGYWVFVPFSLDGGGEIIVNRGHVPQRLKDPATRPASIPQGPVTVTGLLRRPQIRATFDATNDVARNVYYVRDIVELGLAKPSITNPETVRAGSSEAMDRLYLDATAELPRSPVPLALGASPTLSNRHFEYAMTWYAFAGTLLAIFLAYARGRLKEQA